MKCKSCGDQILPGRAFVCLDTAGLEGEACPACHRRAFRRARRRGRLAPGPTVPIGVWQQLLEEGVRAG